MTSMQCWKPHLFSGSVFPIVGVFIPSGSSHLHQCSPHHRSSRDQGPGISTLEPGSLTWNWEVRVCASSLQVRRGLDGYVHGGLCIEVVRFPDSTIWCRNAWYMMFLLISALQYLDRYTIYTYNTNTWLLYIIGLLYTKGTVYTVHLHPRMPCFHGFFTSFQDAQEFLDQATKCNPEWYAPIQHVPTDFRICLQMVFLMYSFLDNGANVWKNICVSILHTWLLEGLLQVQLVWVFKGFPSWGACYQWLKCIFWRWEVKCGGQVQMSKTTCNARTNDGYSI